MSLLEKKHSKRDKPRDGADTVIDLWLPRSPSPQAKNPDPKTHSLVVNTEEEYPFRELYFAYCQWMRLSPPATRQFQPSSNMEDIGDGPEPNTPSIVLPVDATGTWARAMKIKLFFGEDERVFHLETAHLMRLVGGDCRMEWTPNDFGYTTLPERNEGASYFQYMGFQRTKARQLARVQSTPSPSAAWVRASHAERILRQHGGLERRHPDSPHDFKATLRRELFRPEFIAEQFEIPFNIGPACHHMIDWVCSVLRARDYGLRKLAEAAATWTDAAKKGTLEPRRAPSRAIFDVERQPFTDEGEVIRLYIGLLESSLERWGPLPSSGRGLSGALLRELLQHHAVFGRVVHLYRDVRPALHYADKLACATRAGPANRPYVVEVSLRRALLEDRPVDVDPEDVVGMAMMWERKGEGLNAWELVRRGQWRTGTVLLGPSSRSGENSFAEVLPLPWDWSLERRGPNRGIEASHYIVTARSLE